MTDVNREDLIAPYVPAHPEREVPERTSSSIKLILSMLTIFSCSIRRLSRSSHVHGRHDPPLQSIDVPFSCVT